MLCPLDQTPLSITTRQGIEIDYCPKCRGVWLDRGELDKLIERDSSFANHQGYESHERRRYDDDDNHYRERREDYRDERRRYDDDDDHHHKKRKKEGLLGDLFDFG